MLHRRLTRKTDYAVITHAAAASGQAPAVLRKLVDVQRRHDAAALTREAAEILAVRAKEEAAFMVMPLGIVPRQAERPAIEQTRSEAENLAESETRER